MSKLLTAREICARLSVPVHIFNFATRNYGPEHCRRIGLVRVWGEDQIPEIEASLAKTAKRSTKPERRATAGA